MNTKDPSYESPYADPYGQLDVAVSIGQDWAMLQQPNLFKASANNGSTSTNPPSKESGFNAGMVGMGMGQDWAGMAQNPFKTGNPDQMNVEQSFSQVDIGQSIGQDWVMMNGQGNLFTKSAENDEAGFSPFLNVITGGMVGLVERSFCGKYCKALGYARSLDKFPFKQCVNDCLVHYKEIKKTKKYKIKPYTSDIPDVNVDSAMPDLTVDEQAATLAAPATAPAPNNTMMYVIIGIVLLLIIAAIFFFALKNRNKA